MAGNSRPSTSISRLIRHIQPALSGAVLLGCAAFVYPGKTYVLVFSMLFLPLLDRQWRLPVLPPHHIFNYSAWIISLAVITGLLIWRPLYANYAVTSFLLAAIPEEWFFRAYFMDRSGKAWGANLATSIIFSMAHALTHAWFMGLAVFLPSLFYGWLYQRTRDLPLLILLHTLSNLIFIIFLADTMATFEKSLL